MHDVVRLGSAALVGLIVVGCGGVIADEDGGAGTGSGGSTGGGVVSPSICRKACPADPEPPAASVSACLAGKDASGSGCDREYVDVLNCAAGKITCGANGKTDAAKSSQALVSGCSGQLAAYQACALKNIDAGPRPPG